MTAWTVRELPDLSGRLAVVTGAAGGIGFATARRLAGTGAEVVFAGRDPARVRAAAGRASREVPGARVRAAELDLADLTSVAAFAAHLSAESRALDLLVNNAGVMNPPERRTTRDGFELTFGVNHLGHFALTGRLLPLLLAARNPRVVTVSALVARSRLAEPDDPLSERGYRGMVAYITSKLANVLFAQEFQRRADAAGAGLTSVAVHPGFSLTGLQRHSSRLARAVGRGGLQRVLGQPADAAALPSLYAATVPGVTPGGFYGPTGRLECRGTPGPVKPPKAAAEPGRARELWEMSERLTGVTYPWPS
ncbi:SDR family oxidoreductase [Streptomyces avicenniae]|uniref:SDR family oxidoreductase n=1 Tax=Streptomyces avicenniae TaxID=500153 RepID=UPI00069A09E3|nr:SDR family oxidoreductase [Streptomyces avicenniae]